MEISIKMNKNNKYLRLSIDNSSVLWLYEHMNSYSYDMHILEGYYGRISDS